MCFTWCWVIGGRIAFSGLWPNPGAGNGCEIKLLVILAILCNGESIPAAAAAAAAAKPLGWKMAGDVGGMWPATLVCGGSWGGGRIWPPGLGCWNKELKGSCDLRSSRLGVLGVEGFLSCWFSFSSFDASLLKINILDSGLVW